jgi:hypothetical protein
MTTAILTYHWEQDPLYAGLTDEPQPARPARQRRFEPSQADLAWLAQQPTLAAPRPYKPTSGLARMWGRPGWRR